MNEQNYKRVSIYKPLLAQIEKVLEDERITQRNISEFIHSAIRDKIESYLVLFPDLKDNI